MSQLSSRAREACVSATMRIGEIEEPREVRKRLASAMTVQRCELLTLKSQKLLEKGLRERISPTCTLSQNGYGNHMESGFTTTHKRNRANSPS